MYSERGTSTRAKQVPRTENLEPSYWLLGRMAGAAGFAIYCCVYKWWWLVLEDVRRIAQVRRWPRRVVVWRRLSRHGWRGGGGGLGSRR